MDVGLEVSNVLLQKQIPTWCQTSFVFWLSEIDRIGQIVKNQMLFLEQEMNLYWRSFDDTHQRDSIENLLCGQYVMNLWMDYLYFFMICYSSMLKNEVEGRAMGIDEWYITLG